MRTRKYSILRNIYYLYLWIEPRVREFSVRFEWVVFMAGFEPINFFCGFFREEELSTHPAVSDSFCFFSHPETIDRCSPTNIELRKTRRTRVNSLSFCSFSDATALTA